MKSIKNNNHLCVKFYFVLIYILFKRPECDRQRKTCTCTQHNQFGVESGEKPGRWNTEKDCDEPTLKSRIQMNDQHKFYLTLCSIDTHFQTSTIDSF